MTNNDLRKIENLIGYEFDNLALLQQAFVRKSYSEENGGENNEVLEFIGDKALDLTVVKILMEKFGYYVENENEFSTDYSEGGFTNLKKRLVEKKMLAHRIDILGLNQYLIMGKGDINKNAQDEPSVKEDLFEAIIGAVALDCDWNLETIESVLDLMLDPNYYLDNDFEDDDYVNLVQQWFQKNYGELPEWKFPDEFYFQNVEIMMLRRPIIEQGQGNMICTLHYKDYVFTGRGFSKKEARLNAAKAVYEFLEDNGLLYTIKDEIGNPCEELAINQLQELAQKGYFNMPDYKFEETYDEQGYPAWKCYCSIDYKKRISWWGRDYSKRGAKRLAAWCVLKQVLEIEED